MKKNPIFVVETETALLPFLLACFSGKSRNYVKGILKRGQIEIDGTACTDYARILYPGQRVEALLHAGPVQAKLRVPILYEDADIVVIDKPAGMLSISDGKESENTAYRIVNDYVRACGGARVFIVHRLDRETSGVMLLAKSEQIKHRLQENWEASAVRRGYFAVVEGRVQPPEGNITSWLKQTATLLVYSCGEKGGGKLAVTNYQTLQASDAYSLLEVTLETGRKNQIRVHMKELGHPVAGDKKYGARTDPFGRLCLHAGVLTVKHPVSGEEMRFASPMPGDWRHR